MERSKHLMDTGYVWDEDKYGRVRKKHGVQFGEVVDVFEDIDTLYDLDPGGAIGRHLAIGRTRLNRILQVVFSDEDAPLIRIITAFEASEEWKHEYQKEA